MGIPIRVDVGNRSNDVFVLLDVIEKFLEPSIPNFRWILFFKKVTACRRFCNEYWLANLSRKFDRWKTVFVSAPPRVTNPVIIVCARIVIFKLFRRHHARRSEHGGKVSQFFRTQGIDNTLKRFLEVFGVISVPATVELVADPYQEGMLWMVADEFHKFGNQMVKRAVGHFIFTIAFH